MNKNLLLSAVLLVAFSVIGETTFAQTSGTASATLNVNLQDSRSITIDNSVVNLTFNSAADYRDGVSSIATNHLKIVSSSGFQIKVGSTADLTGGTTGTTIPANTITVTPTLASSSTDPGVTQTPQKLGTPTGLPIVTSSKGTMPIAFDVRYKTDGGAYINKKADSYSATVTYEITAP